MNNVRDIDRGYSYIVDQIKLAHNSYTKVGVQENERRDDASEPDMVTIAAWNEFGNRRIPERSFLRSATDEETPNLKTMGDKLYDQVLEGRLTVEKGLHVIGQYLESKIKAKIRSNIPPPNAPATIAQKTVGGKVGNRTLIDTGQLIQSIRHVVFMRYGGRT